MFCRELGFSFASIYFVLLCSMIYNSCIGLYRHILIFVRCVFCERCIGQSASPSPGPDVTTAPDPSAERGVWANIPLPPSTITPILLFDCYRIVFYIICIPGKYSISIGEHYCKIHIRIEGGIFLFLHCEFL